MGILSASLNLRYVFCRHSYYRIFVTALALPLIISGCASARGYPDRLTEPDVALKELKPTYTPANINACGDITCRNRILSAEMVGTDINFSEFERKLFKENREISFLTTVTTLGLTTAGAMTGAPALAGIATGIVGSKEAFDKEILLDQAKNAIHTQMRALRQTVANRIRWGMTRSFIEYPLDSALIDIEEYYNAGTLLGAFIGITSSAGLQVKESEVNKDRVAQGDPPLSFSPLINGGVPAGKIIPSPAVQSDGRKQTDTKKAMKKWIDDDIDGTKRKNLKRWIKENEIKDKNGKDVSPAIFMQGDNFEEARKAAIADPDLGIPQ